MFIHCKVVLTSIQPSEIMSLDCLLCGFCCIVCYDHIFYNMFMSVPHGAKVVGLVTDCFFWSSLHTLYLCSLCSIGFSNGCSVGYDSCLLWYHFACVNIKRAPAKKEWFCRACTRKR